MPWKIHCADIPEKTNPIYLHTKNYWTELLVKEFHQKLFHVGSSNTLSQIRNRYWIPQGRTIKRNVIHHCGICRRNHGRPFIMPKMSPQPAKNLSNPAPFTYMGLDYLSPSHGGPFLEVYCVRSISRKGTPKEIILDNAPLFKLTKTTIEKA